MPRQETRLMLHIVESTKPLARVTADLEHVAEEVEDALVRIMAEASG